MPFRVLLNVGIDPNFPQKSFFVFFWLYSPSSAGKTSNCVKEALGVHSPRRLKMNASCLEADEEIQVSLLSFDTSSLDGQRKITLSGENIFSLATFSAIIYHIRSN